MAIDKSKFIRIIKEQFPGISDDGVKAIMANVGLETSQGAVMKEYGYSANGEGDRNGNNGLFSVKEDGTWVHNVSTGRLNLVKAGYGSATLTEGKGDYKKGTFKQTAKQKADYQALTHDQKRSLHYNGHIDGVAGGFGPLQLTVGESKNLPPNRNANVEAYMEEIGFEGNLQSFMTKLADDPGFGLTHTLGFYKKYEPEFWNAESLSEKDSTSLAVKINPDRKRDDAFASKLNTGDTWATDSIGTYNNLDLTLEENHQYNVDGVPPQPEGEIAQISPTGTQTTTTGELQPGDVGYDPTTTTDPNVPIELTQAQIDADNEKREKEEAAKLKAEEDRQAAEITEEAARLAEMTAQEEYEKEQERIRLEKIKEKEDQRQINSEGQTRVDALDDEDPEYNEEEIQADLQRITDEEGSGEEVELTQIERERAEKKTRLPGESKHKADIRRKKEARAAEKKAEEEANASTEVDANAGVVDLTGQDALTMNQEDEQLDNTNPSDVIAANDEMASSEAEERQNAANTELSTEVTEGEEVPGLADIHREIEVVGTNGNTETITVPKEEETAVEIIERLDLEGSDNKSLEEKLKPPPPPPTAVELEADRVRHVQGDEYDRRKTLIANYESNKTNSILKILKHSNLDADFSGVTNKQEFIKLANKSEDDGGLGYGVQYEGQDAEADWNGVSEQLGINAEVVHAGMQVEQADRVFHQVLTEGIVNYNKPEHVGVPSDNAEDYALFKNALLNAIPYKEFRELSKAGGFVSTIKKEEYIAKANKTVLSIKLEAQHEKLKALNANANNLNFRRKELEKRAATWSEGTQGAQDEINSFKPKYGTHNRGTNGTLRYEQQIKMTPADEQRLIRLNADMKSLEGERLELLKDRDELIGLQESHNTEANAWDEGKEKLFLQYSFDAVDGIFKPVFETTKADLLYNESIRNKYGNGADSWSTLANGLMKVYVQGKILSRSAKLWKPALVVTAGALLADATADMWEDRVYDGYNLNEIGPDNPNGVSYTGILMDLIGGVVNQNYLPVSMDTSGDVINMDVKRVEGQDWLDHLYEATMPGWAGGKGNYSAYSTSKSLAHSIPYMAAIAASGGTKAAQALFAAQSKRATASFISSTNKLYYTGKMGEKIVNGLRKDWMTSPKMFANLNMMRVNHKLTVFDNYADGRRRGMDVGTAMAYGNFLSLATGVSQTIMPDYKFIRDSKGIAKQLFKDLGIGSGATTGRAINKAVSAMATKKAFKTASVNFFKEHVEEQADVFGHDIVKSLYLSQHSPDILKVETQAQVLVHTSLLMLPISGITATRARRNLMATTYRGLHLEGKAIIDNGRQEVAAIKKRMETLTKSDKDVELGKVLKNEMDILNTSIKEAENITEAMRVAPKNVTDTQIDLLVRKKKLMEEKKELGKKDKETHIKEHESIDAKIEAINVEIQENGIGKYQSKLYKTLLDNAVAFSNSKLGKSLGLTVRHFSMDEKGFNEAVEVELQDRTKRIEERNKEIKNLRKDPKANAKRIEELKNDNKRDRKSIDYSGPGFIKWRKNKDGTLSEPEIIINEEAAKDSGNFAVVLHELLHVALMRTIEKSPKSVKAIAFLLRQEMLANPEKYGDIHGYVTREDGKGGKYDQYKFEKDINNMAFDEMFTVFIEALAQGNISVEENLITKFNDFFRRLASKFGVRFEVDGHGGMINFLRDFQEEVTNGGGSFSKGMEKSMTEGMKIKTTTAQQKNADAWEKKMIKLHELDAWGFDDIMVSKSIVTRRGDIYNSKKVKEDLKLSENTIKIVEENRKIRELMMEEGLERDGKIVASEALQARLVENNLPTAISLGNFAARNPKIMGLEVGKRVTADQFISGYYLQLTELARTYDANINEFGQYMNTILPLRYGQILESEKKGSVEGDSKGLDYIADMGDDTDMITTPDDVSTGPTIDTAERLGVKKETKSFVNEGLDQIKELRGLNAMLNESYSEEVAERVAELTTELESKGMLDLDIQNLTVKKAPNLLYKTVAKIFGIDEDKINPRSTKWLANLRKDDKKGSNEVRSAQRAVVKHINVIMASIFNEGHTMAHKSSGMPNSLLAFGYNKSSKRIGNSFPQYKKPNLSENDLLEFLGIFKVKRNGVAGYEFRVDRNTGTKLIAIAQMTDRNMSLQAINKGLEQTGDLDVKVKNSIEDGLSKSSRSITYIRSEHQQTIKRGMPEIGRRLEMLDKEWEMEDIELIFKDVFNGSGVKHKKLAKEMFSATGIIMAYRTAKKGAMSVGKNEFTSFEEWTVEHLEVLESEDYTNSIIKLLGITSVNGEKPTNGEFFTVDGLKDGRTHIGLFMASISEMVSDPKNPMTLERALDLIWIIEQQHKTAAQAGDGSTWFVDGTNETEQAFHSKDKKISKGKSKGKPHPNAGKKVEDGKHRFQHFASKEGSTVDFRKFVNSYLSSELQLPLSGTYSDHKLQTQNKHGVAKSVADKKYDEKLRETEAELAKEAVIIQVIHFAKRLRNKNDNFNEVDFARQMLVFGSSMGTASRRAAQVIGIQDGIIIDGVYDSSVGIILEHGKPHSFLIAELIKIIKTKNESEWAKAMEVPFIDYKANIITNKFDETLTEGGRKSIMDRNPAKYVAGLVDGWTQRLFNVENLGNKHVTVIRLVSDVMKGNFNGKVFGEGHGAAAGLDIKSEEQTNVDKKINEGLKRSKSINYNKSPNGITVLDFDDTLATSNSLIRYTKPDGTKGTLNAEQYASTYEELTELGYEWDFSEFNKVVDGKVAPLFNKAMKLQSKFGPENMFVLTARPMEAAPAIFAFLQANGLNIPIENITGLANSTANAKALWIAEKVGEGYNDFYFADDALQNVQAVDNILEQFDVKRKVQQARSKSINFNRDFNEILDSTTGIDADKQFSAAKAKKRGEDKGKWAIFIPPSAEDFVGLLYYFIGKGKKGEEQFKWFKDNLISPLNRAYRELDSAKQAISNDYKRLSESFPDVRKKLFKKIEGSEFTYNDAIRVYLWSKFGFKIWGLSETDRKELVGIVEADENLVSFAETLGKISKSEKGYVAPTEQWMVEDIRTDLMEATNKVGRKIFFAEFLENAAIVFSEENLNKIEAIYGSDFREALEDMLYRIENGTNRSFGSNKLVNRFMNWINGSVGTTMFFNSRSAVLQSLSLVNFINWTDNNLLAAAKAFANPKQFWADFTMIFNSDMLKQRRAGRSFDINSQELASQVSNSKKPFRSALNYLLQLGFLPTQIMDSFAIASGGSAFYRNRVNTYLVDGLTLVEAEQRAFADFQEIAEATQQSARQDMVSQQQASVLGRIILAFQNTPMQYARLMKKSILDLVAGRGDAKSHVSRIIYYGAVQNIMFYTLQTALFAAMFGDDEDEEVINKKTERVISGSIDSILRGMGVGGAVVATLKNMVIKFAEEQGKPRHQKNDAAVLMEMLNISPPIGIKARQIQSAQRTLNWNQDTISEMPYYNLDNPVWESAALTTQALTNIPLARLHSKVNNLRESMNKENEGWQRIALFMGWTKWNLGAGSKKKKKSTKGFKRKEFKRDTFKRKVFTREI